MKKGKFDFTKLYIYRFRYWIGYGLASIGLIASLVFVSIYLPGGLSNHEIQSVIKSGTIGFNIATIDMINLPYHILQNMSFHIFGISILSIKLPSIILAFLSVIGIVLLLRQWFKPSIAMLASLIAITTGQFLFIAQNGTPDILYVFWPVWLILIACQIQIQKKLKNLLVIIFFAIATLSLYTPLSIYVLIVMALAIILHPHLRFMIKRLSKLGLFFGLITIVLISAPLILALIKVPSLGLTLLGIPTSWPNIYTNILSLVNQYVGFVSPANKTIITPFFELSSFLLIALGSYFVFKTRQTAKSYLLILWLILLLPIIVFSPNHTGITFLPLTLLLASGLNGLLAHWYELFPRNPYARIGGLVPIVILIGVIVLSGVNRYVYGYRYDPVIVANFSNDLQLLPTKTKFLIVTKSESKFYKVVEKYDKSHIIINQPAGGDFLASRAAKQSFKGYEIDKIITTSNQNNSDRFYLYKKTTK